MYFLDGVKGNGPVQGKSQFAPAQKTVHQQQTRNTSIFSRREREEVERVKREVKFTAPEIKKDAWDSDLEELKGYERFDPRAAFDIKPGTEEEMRAEMLKARQIIADPTKQND